MVNGNMLDLDSWHFRLPVFYICLWGLAEVVVAQRYPLRQSCKKISLLHCIVAFALSSVWLAYHFVKGGYSLQNYALTDYEFPGTFEHHIVTISMAYFIVDMPFAIAFHKAFIVHHLLCICAFGAIQGYMRYWPFNTDFMEWETAPRIAPMHLKQYMLGIFGQDPGESTRQMQFLMGGFNGVFNLWMAELGGLFFHINRAFQGTEWEMPSRGVFVLMFTFSRCYLWPMYIRNLYQEALSKSTNYHLVGAILETGLFLTNLHFLYKNIAPIWQSGRLMHRKPKYYHREWLDKHPSWKRAASLVVPEDRLNLSDSYRSRELGESSDEPEGLANSPSRNTRSKKKAN